jgi:hypothetical protein
METKITGIVYLDMLNSFSFQNYTKITKKSAFTSSKTAHPLITLKKRASTSTAVSQVGGLV